MAYDGLNDFGENDFGRGRFAGDAGVFARFYVKPVVNEQRSEKEGRPIYDDKVFVEIRAAGNANNIIDRKATDEDKRRFREQFALFNAGRGEELVGTPLSEVVWIARSQIEELAYLRIRTVEALANISDDVCSKLVGLYDLKRKAQAYLEQANKPASQDEVDGLKATNELLAGQLEAMTKQMNEMAEAMAAMRKPAEAPAKEEKAK